MTSKLFIKLFFFLIGTLTLILFYLSYLGYLKDNLIIKSQERVEQSKSNSEIVFIGDSSLEYGLDEKYFSKLINRQVSNLALTATAHNLSATFNMIRNIIKNNKKVKYIIIMQNPSMWYYDFSEGGYCSTLDNLGNQEVISNSFLIGSDCFKYKYMNIDFIKKFLKKDKEKKKEKPTYKDGTLNIHDKLNNNKFLEYEKIHFSKQKEIKMIDDYLENKNIKVFYVQGTLHKELYLKYSEVINMQHDILRKLKNITFIEEYLYPLNENMGNTENHVHETYKLESTEFYYRVLKKYILID